MADENSSGKEKAAPEAQKISSAPETDSQKELKKETSEKSGKSGKSEKETKKSPKKKKSSKKRSTKSHQSKKKDKKSRGDKNRRTQEEPTFSTTASSPSESDGGETLAPCSEKEWEHGSAAYNAALLNVKRKPNRVTVFALKKKGDKDGKAASPKTAESSSGTNSLRSASSNKLKKKTAKNASSDKADKIGKIVAGIVRQYLDGKNEENIQVEIKLISNDGTSTPVVQ
uniref:Uncharacterized protein n=1 Tax=Panagrolaimus sp. ES5 TaxID=591445 RepID=A0AC34FL75_9BILA